MRVMRFLIAPVLACAAGAAIAQVSVDATISGEVVPGVYGHVVIGNRPPPPVVYAQPVVVQPAPVVVGAPPMEPVYLHVPPGHAKHWRQHCHEYHACDRPVYFVKSAEYEPGYHKHDHDHDHDRDHGHDHDRDHDRDHDHGHHDD